MNMQPGGGTTLSYTVEVAPSANASSMSVHMWFGSAPDPFGPNSFGGTRLDAGATVFTAHVYIPYTATVMENCRYTSGVGQIAFWTLTIIGRSNVPSDWHYGYFPNTYSCSVDTPVTLNAPTFVTRACGPDNDIIDIASQPEGVDFDNILAPPWVNGARTVTYSALPGYYLNGQSSFDLEDTNEPCIINPPTVSAQCGPLNDIINVPQQETGVSWTESNWIEGKKTVTFSGTQGMTLQGDISYTFEDVNTSCEGDDGENDDNGPGDGSGDDGSDDGSGGDTSGDDDDNNGDDGSDGGDDGGDDDGSDGDNADGENDDSRPGDGSSGDTGSDGGNNVVSDGETGDSDNTSGEDSDSPDTENPNNDQLSNEGITGGASAATDQVMPNVTGLPQTGTGVPAQQPLFIWISILIAGMYLSGSRAIRKRLITSRD